jgi:hypothetical protein
MPSVTHALVLLLALGAAACSTANAATPPKPVAPAPPPVDDGNTAQGGQGGSVHSAALEQLRIGKIAARTDKQSSVSVPLPDAENWTRVRFLTVPSLVGFRYGKEHHAIVAAFITHVDDNTVQNACNKSFESWAMPWIDAFEVDLKHDAPQAFSWSVPKTDAKAPKTISIVDIDPVMAKTATVLARDSYAAAWAAYPAWPKACLVVGVAVPSRDDESRARAVRDRFVQEVLPKIVVTTTAEPKERY